MAEFNEVSMALVLDVILKSPSKFCPLDPIPTQVLKVCVEDLLPSITTIVNSSLQSGLFLTALKQGCVRPLIKKPTLYSDTYSSYRPINTLAFLSKVIEWIVSSQSLGYLTDNYFYPNLQSVYRAWNRNYTTTGSKWYPLHLGWKWSWFCPICLLHLTPSITNCSSTDLRASLDSVAQCSDDSNHTCLADHWESPLETLSQSPGPFHLVFPKALFWDRCCSSYTSPSPGLD